MFYDLHSLSQEELERLYMLEGKKFLAAIGMGFPQNTLQAIKVNLQKIDYELNHRKWRVRKRAA